MALWHRLKTECEANRGKAAVLAVLVLALVITAGRSLGGRSGTIANLVAPFLSAPAAEKSSAGSPWQNVASPRPIARPVERHERLRDPFWIDPDSMPLVVELAADVVEAAPKPQPLPEREVLEEEPLAEDAPDIKLQGTTAKRLAIIDGRVVRLGTVFSVGDKQYALDRIGTGWIVLRSESGETFRYVVRSVYKSARSRDDLRQ